MDHISEILLFMLGAFKKAWPFILLSIPLSVAVNLSGASTHIKSLLGKNPALSILLATLLGALSPLCSCTVIPVIFSLLTAGVPIGPVMSFWIASPSMDPEIFFLSVSTLGWNLAIWRLASTFVLSLSAGFLAHLLAARGWFDGGILRATPQKEQWTLGRFLKSRFSKMEKPKQAVPSLKTESSCCGTTAEEEIITAGGESCGCSFSPIEPEVQESCCSKETQEEDSRGEATNKRKDLVSSILKESGKSLIFVGKFLVIAYLIEALILLYVPSEWIESVLGNNGPVSIAWATLFGLPFYTTNLAALGILGGLLQKGMIPAAALAFLISGPTTTLPAMSAVFGIARPRVFLMYLGISLWGALLFGLMYLSFA